MEFSPAFNAFSRPAPAGQAFVVCHSGSRGMRRRRPMRVRYGPEEGDSTDEEKISDAGAGKQKQHARARNLSPEMTTPK